MKPMFPICPIVNSSVFFDVFLVLIISWILTDHAINLCLGGVTVSVLKLKRHLRIIFVSDNPPLLSTCLLRPLACRGWVCFCHLVGLLP
jgi:hypothetical protein